MENTTASHGLQAHDWLLCFPCLILLTKVELFRYTLITTEVLILCSMYECNTIGKRGLRWRLKKAKVKPVQYL